MDSSSESTDSENTPPQNEETSESIITNDILPSTSKNIYKHQYNIFKDWCNNNNITNIDETVLIEYFQEKAEKSKSSTLWSIYSMLKSTINLHDNIDISNFTKLKAFIKRQSKGYKGKKSNIFTRDDITKFLLEAPDDSCLMWKFVLVMGLAGACRCNELVKMTTNDIQDKGDVLIVNIPRTKNNTSRTFIITDQILFTNAIEIYKKYVSLRPKMIPHDRIFLNYKNGKCKIHPVGINTFSKIPYMIANYLNKSNPQSYTGHCFRRTSASLLANDGGDSLCFKHHGDDPGKEYYKILAERRRVALEEALKENEMLHEKVKQLEEENEHCNILLHETRELVQTLTQMINEGNDENDDAEEKQQPDEDVILVNDD